MRLRCARLLAAMLPAAAASASEIYWTDWSEATQGVIQRADTDTLQTETVLAGLPSQLGGLAVDAEAGKVYWGAERRVYRANLDGTGVEDLLGQRANTAQALQIDPVNRMLYLAESFRVSRVPLDGGTPEHLGDFDLPQDIVLDPSADRMYVSECAIGTPGRVVRAHLDGSDAQTLVDAIPHGPAGLAISPQRNELYWGTFNFSTGAGRVQRAGLDGSGVATLFSGRGVDAVANDPLSGDLFWVGGVEGENRAAIYRSGADGSGAAIVALDFAYPGSITVVPEPATAGSLLLIFSLAHRRGRRPHRSQFWRAALKSH